MTKIIGTTSGGAVVPDSLTSTIYEHWSKPLPWTATTTATAGKTWTWSPVVVDDDLTDEERQIVDEVIKEFGGTPPIRASRNGSWVTYGAPVTSATPLKITSWTSTSADDITLTVTYDET
jgi:hypothetical protein